MLNIGEVPISSFTGFCANLAIAASLLWWKDLGAEIEAQETKTARLLRLWRPAALATAAGSGLLQLPFLHCAALPAPAASSASHAMLSDPVCAASLEPPIALFGMLQPVLPLTQHEIGALGGLGLGFYVTYLLYYIAFPLRVSGRAGRKERRFWSIIDPLIALGWLTAQEPAGEGRDVARAFLPVALALGVSAAYLLQLQSHLL
jgi:hypothetical protein